MMKKRKIKLDVLSLQSFMTTADKNEIKKINGGINISGIVECNGFPSWRCTEFDPEGCY